MGTANVLWLDAASFFVSVVIVWMVIPAVLVRPAEKKKGGDRSHRPGKAGQLLAGRIPLPQRCSQRPITAPLATFVRRPFGKPTCTDLPFSQT